MLVRLDYLEDLEHARAKACPLAESIYSEM